MLRLGWQSDLGAVYEVAALLQALEHHRAGAEVDPVDGERQGLEKVAAIMGQGHTQRAYRAVTLLGHVEEVVVPDRGRVFSGIF
jgi:hypothetical protein